MKYAVPNDVAWVTDEYDQDEIPAVYLMVLPDGEPLVLTGTAALIWILAAEGEDVAPALRAVITDPPPDLEETTTRYLADLVARHLLVAEDTSPVGGCP